jgi:exo-beta-1,3-glucanase (GH17 family)
MDLRLRLYSCSELQDEPQVALRYTGIYETLERALTQVPTYVPAASARRHNSSISCKPSWTLASNGTQALASRLSSYYLTNSVKPICFVVIKTSELGFTTIRSYSTDCSVFESVVPECQKYGLKVIYGILLEVGDKGPFSEYANDQLNYIKEKAPKDSVAMVIVENECIFNNNCCNGLSPKSHD